MPTESYDLIEMFEVEKSNPPDTTDGLYSNEVREIISHKPLWLVRNGIGLFFLIFVILYSISFFIYYPDIIKAPARIVGNNLPKQVVSRVEGKLLSLYANENTIVESGDVLAVLESNADYEQIIALDKWLLVVESKINSEIYQKIPSLPKLNKLGDIQKNYQEIELQLYQLSWNAPKGYFEQKKQAIQKDLKLIEQLKINVNKQKILIENDLALQENLLRINEGMVKEKILAPLDLTKDQTAVISRKQQLLQTDAGTINQNTSIITKEKELLEIEKNKTDIIQNFRTALFNTKAAITEWKNKYLIISSETGKVQFSSYFQQNSWIKSGQDLFYIVPKQPIFFAEISASQKNFGKIQVGQKVNIALNGFPRSEYGVLKGSIQFIPSVPYKDTIFLVKVQLSKGLITNYNKQLHFSNNLTGVAEIITADASLAERLLYHWKDLFNR